VLFFKKSKKIVRLKDIIPEGEELIIRYRYMNDSKLIIGLMSCLFLFFIGALGLFFSIKLISLTTFDGRLFFGYIFWAIVATIGIFNVVKIKRNNTVYLTKRYLIFQNGKRYLLRKIWFNAEKFRTQYETSYSFALRYRSRNSDILILQTDIKTHKYNNFIKALHNISQNDLILFYLKDDFHNALNDFGMRSIKLIGGFIEEDDKFDQKVDNVLKFSKFMYSFFK